MRSEALPSILVLMWSKTKAGVSINVDVDILVIEVTKEEAVYAVGESRFHNRVDDDVNVDTATRKRFWAIGALLTNPVSMVLMLFITEFMLVEVSIKKITSALKLQVSKKRKYPPLRDTNEYIH